MRMKNRFESVQLVNYTRGEEILNVLTHLAGLGIPVFILIKAVPLCEGKPFPMITAYLYAFGTALCFMCSVLYHITPHSNLKKMFRVADHSAIFFSVAGTVTGCVPAVFQKGSPVGAVLMLVLCWGSVITGLVLTVFFFGRFRGIRMAMYILTSTVCALIGANTFKNLPKGALWCLLLGGAVLLMGCVLYGIGKKKRYVHSLFHVFIVVGLGIYCYGIYNFVYLLL